MFSKKQIAYIIFCMAYICFIFSGFTYPQNEGVKNVDPKGIITENLQNGINEMNLGISKLEKGQMLLNELITPQVLDEIFKLYRDNQQMQIETFWERLAFILAKQQLSEYVAENKITPKNTTEFFKGLKENHAKNQPALDTISRVEGEIAGHIRDLRSGYYPYKKEEASDSAPKRLNKGIEYFDEVLLSDPRCVDAYFWKIKAYLKLGDKQSAATTYETFLQQDIQDISDKININLDELREIFYDVARIYMEGERPHFSVRMELFSDKNEPLGERVVLGEKFVVRMTIKNLGGVTVKLIDLPSLDQSSDQNAKNITVQNVVLKRRDKSGNEDYINGYGEQVFEWQCSAKERGSFSLSGKFSADIQGIYAEKVVKDKAPRDFVKYYNTKKMAMDLEVISEEEKGNVKKTAAQEKSQSLFEFDITDENYGYEAQIISYFIRLNDYPLKNKSDSLSRYKSE
jgi:TolA-binding protein